MLEGAEQRTERFLMWRKQSLDAFNFFFKQYAGRAPFFTPLHVVATWYYTEYTILCILLYAVRAYRSSIPTHTPYILALSTEDAEPRLVATSYAVRAYRSIETQNTSSHSRTGGLTS